MERGQTNNWHTISRQTVLASRVLYENSSHVWHTKMNGTVRWWRIHSNSWIIRKKEKDAVCGKPRSGQRSTDWPLFFWRREDVFAQTSSFKRFITATSTFASVRTRLNHKGFVDQQTTRMGRGKRMRAVQLGGVLLETWKNTSHPASWRISNGRSGRGFTWDLYPPFGCEASKIILKSCFI